MRTHNKIAAAFVAVAMLAGSSAASAAGKSITCYNTKTGAKKVVQAAKCPTGFSTKAPAKKVVVKTEAGVTVSNAYVKALDTAMPMNGTFMTAAFMFITNISDRDVALVGGSADWAPMVQVHEVVNGVMRQKAGGLTIKSGYTEVLQAGGNHVMFMNLPKKVMAGDEVTFTLLFADGGQLKVTAPVKAMNAGSETYKPTASM